MKNTGRTGEGSTCTQVIVAGCGPAGMMAAIAAAREGAKVIVLEGMEKPGKKLLITGNGRCNLTNRDRKLPLRYHSVAGNLDWPREALAQFSVQDTLHFFRELGLLTTERDGYVYPYTGQASSVLELLLAELKRLKVKLKFSEKIERLEKTAEGWQVRIDSWTYFCDSLILCCGSRAAKQTGSDGSGYELARQAGHSVTAVVPSLTALNGRGRFFSACAGVRCRAKVSLYVEQRLAGEDIGELQWTENGISGIVVFQVSRYASLALKQARQVQAELDLLPELEKTELMGILQSQRERLPDGTAAEALAGLLPKKLLLACLEQTKIKPADPVGKALKKDSCERLIKTIKRISFPVTGVRSFDQCQVCAGGVSLAEVNPQTMESRLMPGLYFAGELLDVDGPCGGYNLQWAWSSGYVAGKHAPIQTLH